MLEDSFTKKVLEIVVAQVSQTIGWTAIDSGSLEVLVDVLNAFLNNLTTQSAEIASHVSGGLTRQPTVGIVWKILEKEGFNFTDMKHFLDAFRSNLDLEPRLIAKYPLPVEDPEDHLDLYGCGSVDSELVVIPEPEVYFSPHKKTTRVRLLQKSPQWSKWQRRAMQIMLRENTVCHREISLIEQVDKMVFTEIMESGSYKPRQPRGRRRILK